MSTLADFLNWELERRGWTRQTLAERASITGPTLTNILNSPEKVVPRLETLAALAKALEVPLARLIGLCGFPIGARSTDDEQLLDRINDDRQLRGIIEELVTLPPLGRALIGARIAYMRDLSELYSSDLPQIDLDTLDHLAELLPPGKQREEIQAFTRSGRQRWDSLRAALDKTGEVFRYHLGMLAQHEADALNRAVEFNRDLKEARELEAEVRAKINKLRQIVLADRTQE